jgi:hydrogenase assembly chaperone HypC/HupF
MCRAIPVLVSRVEGEFAIVNDGGEERAVALLGTEQVQAGDYVYCHAGVALGRLSPEEAEGVFELLLELDRALDEDYSAGAAQ